MGELKESIGSSPARMMGGCDLHDMMSGTELGPPAEEEWQRQWLAVWWQEPIT